MTVKKKRFKSGDIVKIRGGGLGRILQDWPKPGSGWRIEKVDKFGESSHLPGHLRTTYIPDRNIERLANKEPAYQYTTPRRSIMAKRRKVRKSSKGVKLSSLILPIGAIAIAYLLIRK